MRNFNKNQLICSILLIIHLVNCNPTEENGLKPNCVNIKNLFNNEGLFSNAKIKSDPANQRICKRDKSCCTKGNELKLNIKSKTEFQQKLQQHINNSVSVTLVNWAEQFNTYYLNVIQTGHKEFDMMFQRLYGPRYKENYEIFNDLFKGIASYHEKEEQNLENTLDDFFEKLFVRLFKMLNPNFQFQDEFISCISSSMRFVEPFGDVPKNLLITLKKQLGATRTFVQGLYAGANIIKKLNQIDISNSCAVDLMQINYCSLCSGYINLKPCKANCEYAYSKCMINYQEFENEQWNKYLNTIIQFGKRLESSLNLENTMGSLNYKISDMIMYFQENEVNIRNKVFEKCNTKKVNKRSTANDDDEEEDEDGPLLTIAKMKETRAKNQQISKTWKILASEVKKKIRSLKSYWTKLPKGICKNSNNVKCWNSTDLIDQNKQIKPVFDSQILKETKYYRLIDAQKSKLSIVNNKLISSYNGNGLEKFDFDSQATVNIGTLTEPNDDYLSGDEEDDDYGDKIDANDQQMRETDDQNEEESNNKLSDDQEEPIINENLRRDTSLSDPANAETNNIDNNFLSNNHESSGLEKPPKDESLKNSSISSFYLTNISIFSLIISQFLNLFISIYF